jgi:cell wall-associated NlpC family hydrolase
MQLYQYIIVVALFATQALLLTCSPSVRFSRHGNSNVVQSRDYTPNFVVIDSNVIIECLRKYEKTSYKWGGSTKNGIDCSGLVQAVFKECGKVQLPRTSEEQVDYGIKVDRKYLRGGDLLFFSMRSRKIDHVGIYIGNDRFMHASSSGGVRTDSILDENYEKNLVIAKRLFFE